MKISTITGFAKLLFLTVMVVWAMIAIVHGQDRALIVPLEQHDADQVQSLWERKQAADQEWDDFQHTLSVYYTQQATEVTTPTSGTVWLDGTKSSLATSDSLKNVAVYMQGAEVHVTPNICEKPTFIPPTPDKGWHFIPGWERGFMFDYTMKFLVAK